MRIDNRINFYWLCLVPAYSVVHVFLLPDTFGRQSIEDNGLFSWLTIFFVLAAMVITMSHARTEASNLVRFSLYATAYVMFIYALREADVHRLFTEEHVTKLKFYRHPEIDIVQKVLAAIPMLIFLSYFLYLGIRYTGFILKESPRAIAFFVGGSNRSFSAV